MEIKPTASYPRLVDAILQTAAYADVFDYPLTAVEIHRYLTGVRASPESVELALDSGLLSGGPVLRKVENFYTLPGRETLAHTRLRREEIAGQMWPEAVRYGRLIASLPFVRMLAVTGSLAMNNVERDPDIDYFIVTVPGRLWTVRALALAAARMAALQGARLCPNYLVTERALVFPEQSLYSAHELAQMVPLYGMDVYARIRALNRWTDTYLPNAAGAPPSPKNVSIDTRRPPSYSSPRTSHFSLLTLFENWEMERKIRRLSREQRDSPESCFGADVCKGHIHRHGQRTEQFLRERLERLALEQPL